MGHAKRVQDRRRQAGKKPFTGYPDTWFVEGKDQHGEDFVWQPKLGIPPEEAQREAEETAARLNRLGGSVTISRGVWSNPYCGFKRVTE